MDRDNEVAAPNAPAAPADPETAERVAAFKRGAPIPKPKPRSQVTPSQAAPRPDRAARVAAPPRQAPEPAAPATSLRDPGPGETEADRSRAPAPETGGGASSGDASRPSSSRRRRGGRGRGGSAAFSESPESSEAEAPAPRPTRSRQGSRGSGGRSPAKDRPADDEPAEISGDALATAEGEGAGATGTAPRKRRRRGGRGRGRSGGDAADASDQGADDEAPTGDTPETQRDDALPDAPADGASRSRRGRGVGSSTKTSETKTKRASGKAGGKAEGEEGGRGKARPMSVEEQVASGGPTRGLRATRSRTGGREGRRRREPQVTPPRITDKLMVITEHGERDQIAVLEEDTLVQHYVTRTGATSMVGNVYLGRVQNVLPGMEAAFVDVGRGRNGVLYAGEVNYRPEDLEGPAPRIEQVLKSGQSVVVQVTKDPMGGKGARLTAQISLPGRYLVFAPNQSLSGISRRLGDNERKRLKSIMRTIKPEGHGVIVRTAAEGASEEALTHDLERLVRQWDEIQRSTKKAKAPAVLYEEPELTVRVVRDLFTDEEFRELVTDSRRIYDKVMAYVDDVAPDLAPKIRLHEGKLPAFEEHRIVEQIHKALDKKVWLPSGGYLFIERTEAMTIVDVNTGKSVGKTNLEETVVNTNLEAAKEVARQLRLRDIGGIIVIDFIDMLLEKNKKQVEDTMKEALAIDKTRSQVFEIGPLGLMQVTRKRVSSGLVESFSETCPTCEGRGILVNYEA
jgi:ribonuclease E